MARLTSSNLRILAIETSCDETALALVEASGCLPAGSQALRAPKFKVLKEIVASQVKVHRPFGGVVPTLAKREHIKNLPLLFRQIFCVPPKAKSKAQSKNFSTLRAPRFTLRNIDIIAVTVGPGLEPALWAGIEFAKELRKKCKVSGVKCQIVGVNHLEGHLYSFLLPSKSKRRLRPKDIFPAVALIVSGGHTILLLLKNLKTWEKIGETRDDAVGEAFDKVARMLRLPYPGGPELEKLATEGNPEAINFPRPMLHNNSPSGKYDFSFSGLKTAVLYYLREHILLTNADVTQTRVEKGQRKSAPGRRRSAPISDVAASFQQAAIDVLVAKTMRAVKEFKAKSVILSGGVAANSRLRKVMRQETRKIGIGFLAAEQKYNTDNAVMIAAAAYMSCLRKKKYPLKANGALDI